MMRGAPISALLATSLLGSAAVAQERVRVPIDLGEEQGAAGKEPLVIDILVPVPQPEAPTAAEIKACEEARDAARVSQEIIVCGELGDDPSQWFSGGREAWERKYAEKTAFDGEVRAPDVAGAGIFRGPASVSGLCFIPPCPQPPALIIDVEALPDAPAGSDADRIARGLAPLEQDDEEAEAERARRHRALGLPPPDLDTEGD